MYKFDFSFVRSGAPIITLSSTGLAFNSIVIKMLDKPEYIDIGYDENANAIGVCAHRSENDGNAYEFEPREKNGWVRISCRDFMRYLAQRNSLDFSKARQFIPEYDKDSDMLIVIVDEAHMKQPKQLETE